MNLTERLRLELYIREQIDRHGDSFYVELESVLKKIENDRLPVSTEQAKKINTAYATYPGRPGFRVKW